MSKEKRSFWELMSEDNIPHQWREGLDYARQRDSDQLPVSKQDRTTVSSQPHRGRLRQWLHRLLHHTPRVPHGNSTH